MADERERPDMTRLTQLAAWVEGRSLHDLERDECVPDYSCCHPELAVPIEERELYLTLYIQGRDKAVERMQFRYLSHLLERVKPKTHHKE